MSGVCNEVIRYLCLAATEVCVGIGIDCATYRHDCTARLCQCSCSYGDRDQDYPTEREALLAEDRLYDDRMVSRGPSEGITQVQPSPTQSPQTTR